MQLLLGDGGSGVTRDVSASGVFFETETEQVAGSLVDFTIEFETPSGEMRLKCHGQVVRIERHGKRQGAAVKILESKFEAGPSSPAKVRGLPAGGRSRSPVGSCSLF